MRARDAVLRAALLLVLAVTAGGTRTRTRSTEPRAGGPEDGGPRVVFELAAAAPGGVVTVALSRVVEGKSGAGRTSTHVLGPEGATVDLVAGPPCRLDAASEEAVVWPRSVVARNGDVVRFQAEPLAEVRLRAGGRADESPLRRLAFAPDRFARPAGPRDRVAALQVAVDLAAPVAEPCAEGLRVRLPPDTMWWCLGDIGRIPFLTRLSAGEQEVVVLERPRLRRLDDEPRVAGAQIPPDTLVAPGRLDLWAVACVRDAVLRRGWRGAVIRGTDRWTGADLPAADVLTLAHPRFGFAYPAWTDGPIDARPEPCEIRFEARHGGRFAASVAVWPAWPGSDVPFSRPFDAGLRYVTAGAESLTFRGLPPGDYRFDYRAAPPRDPLSRELRQGSRRLSASSPREVVVVATGPE